MSTSTRVTALSCKTLRVRSGKLPAKSLAALCSDLVAGAVVIFPTETVYGLGASVFHPRSIRRIYQLKGRTWRKPLAILVSSLESAWPLIEEIPPEAQRLAVRFWPGPLTLILKASSLGRIVAGGLSSIAVRVPDHPIANAILEKVGVPLATTSVNRAGQTPASTGLEAKRLFGSQVNWLIDGGPCRVKQPSSVVDLTHYPFMVIRDGAINKRSLESVLFMSTAKRS